MPSENMARSNSASESESCQRKITEQATIKPTVTIGFIRVGWSSWSGTTFPGLLRFSVYAAVAANYEWVPKATRSSAPAALDAALASSRRPGA